MIRNRKPSTRSPLRTPPLRNPGESLADQIESVVYDTAASQMMMMIACLIAPATLEIVFWILGSRPHPLLLAGLCLIAAAVVAARLIRTIQCAKQLRLGLQGEKAVGQFLETLRGKGFAVFHDIVTTRGNIDHVVVGREGVFAIETKTVSKPTDRDAIVTYDGTMVRVDGFAPERDPIPQALAVADHLREIIIRGIDRELPIRPVVLYPGWFVERQPKGCKVWVLAPRAFEAFLQYEEPKLSDPEVAAIRSTIDAYIRAQTQ
jgi:hypothetical protein